MRSGSGTDSIQAHWLDDGRPCRFRLAEAIAGMDEIERLRMWAHYLVDQACWRATPTIDERGARYLHANARVWGLLDFYTQPDFSRLFGTEAAWYLEMYYEPTQDGN